MTVRREDVARKIGVSAMTVTRVVTGQGYVSPTMRKKVEKAVAELNYIPNKIASNLVSQNSKNIAVVLRELTNPYFITLVDEMIARASEYGYVIMIFKTDERNIDDVFKEIISNRVIGIINLMFTVFPEKINTMLQSFGVRRIFTGCDEFEFRIDYAPAMLDAFNCLKKGGAKHVSFISGLCKNNFESDERSIIFLKHIDNFGFEKHDNLILKGEYPKQESYVVGFTLMNELLDRDERVDSVLCLNDMMAFGAMKAVITRGKRIPEDISIIGIDNILMSNYFNPSLSTISVDIAKEAELYVKYLIGEIENPKYVMTAQFVERESTRTKVNPD